MKEIYGKGGAIKSAQQYVSGEYVIIQDADLEYNPKDIYALLDRIEIKKLKQFMVQEY